MASGREHNLASTLVSAPLGLGIGMIIYGQGAPLAWPASSSRPTWTFLR
ncbi:MAG: hypothetical protein GVY30_00600 [Chloroflexi bacterium]|jgi:hypothetical protein|nr:hypothetical protein [Chloroflexota bacterium]